METFKILIERTLTDHDSKHHIPFTVAVPPGTTCLRIRFTYAPQVVDGINNLLTLTLFDPSGWRGAGHRQCEVHLIEIAAGHASPGFLPGAIQPSGGSPPHVWIVVVDAHLVMPGPPCTLRLEVTGTDEPPDSPAPHWRPGRTASRAPGWYRGDLHAHTIHSDAAWDVPDLAAFARAHRLDFVTLTDHNTVSGLAQMDSCGSDDLLVMGGLELTTFWGHALALGGRDWIDWRTSPGGRGMDEIEHAVTARGGLFVIAHPGSIGDPYCTGCDWKYPTLMPGAAQAVEVWNGDWAGDSNNEVSFRLACDWLNQGHRLALTAGTDAHGENTQDSYSGFNLVGFNIVFASDLSESEILKAIRAGHLYLSSGPRLELEVETAGKTVRMGDTLAVKSSALVKCTARWDGNPPDARLDLIVDGVSQASIPAAAGGSWNWEFVAGQAHWCLLTLRDAAAATTVAGRMLALTNPVYFFDPS